MLARGFTANGANTILIDINETSLLETKAELETIVNPSPTTIITWVYSRRIPLTAMH